MKVIVTNDDGIDAPGLEVLVSVAAQLGCPVVVAPNQAQSGVGHRVTVRSPIRVFERAKNRYEVIGTPADCARIGLKVIAPDARWVLAGINPGSNLGVDVYPSGTVAAAREAAILGCPSAAFSQYISLGGTIDWDLTGKCASGVLRMLARVPLGPRHFWNVNLPHPLRPGVQPSHAFCDIDPNPHGFDFRIDGGAYTYEGLIHERPRDPGKDVDVCLGGAVAITRIPLQTGNNQGLCPSVGR